MKHDPEHIMSKVKLQRLLLLPSIRTYQPRCCIGASVTALLSSAHSTLHSQGPQPCPSTLDPDGQTIDAILIASPVSWLAGWQAGRLVRQKMRAKFGCTGCLSQLLLPLFNTLAMIRRVATVSRPPPELSIFCFGQRENPWSEIARARAVVSTPPELSVDPEQ
ncbi:hypothetical protein Vi05172_g13075 [Venturia inaequalis]|nr:hypothetical protein Vi05172_g13075 [Venturia inaequalis]